MKELVGKTISRILVNADDTILAFVTDAGIIAYETEGGCCSHTWFESITGVDALIGQTVLTQESVEIPEAAHRTTDYKNDHYQEKLQDYGEKFTTIKGYCDIVYRNSSNGYYGGWAGLLNTPPNISAFTEITDDWAAA